MLGETVRVIVDRPLGSTHPKWKDLRYPVNYGYVEGVPAPDGEEQDVYILGEEVPLEACCGRISAAGALGCPPAVPVVLCGQRMDAAAVEVLRYYGFHRCAVLTE